MKYNNFSLTAWMRRNVAFWRQFHNSKPLLGAVFLSIEKGVPPQILEVIGDETNTRE
jgi:hypothetical protein